jgi:hypothetical protein
MLTIDANGLEGPGIFNGKLAFSHYPCYHSIPEPVLFKWKMHKSLVLASAVFARQPRPLGLLKQLALDYL